MMLSHMRMASRAAWYSLGLGREEGHDFVERTSVLDERRPEPVRPTDVEHLRLPGIPIVQSQELCRRRADQRVIWCSALETASHG